MQSNRNHKEKSATLPSVASDDGEDRNCTFGLQDRIELFVEGELSRAQRNELFADLDQTPGSWKQLAFALIEGQAIRNAVTDACADSAECSTGNASEPMLVPEQRFRLNRSWFSLASMAATILLAFGLGYLTSRHEVEPEIVDVVTPGHDLVQDDSTAMPGSVESAPLAELSTEQSSGALAEQPQRDIKNGKKANQIVGYATYIGNYGLQSSPVFLGESLEKTWSRENPPKLNPTIEQKFAKAGVRAKPERRFVSLELKDGPLLTIPIDDWKLLRVNREMF